MSKVMSRTHLDTSKSAVDTWDTAISDAELAIIKAREKIKHLKHSIETFRRLRDLGEPFPGEAKSDAAQK